MRPPLREVVAHFGLDARRSLGQHFLLDMNLCARIARAAGPLDGMNVVEVGPGPGGLTRALLDANAESVTAIELDPRACAAIDALAGTEPRLHLVNGDATQIDVTTLAPPPRMVIANLPYNVATPLLIRWLRQATSFVSLTLMFQLEVAERICASPGNALYGRLSVLSGLTCISDILFRLPPHAFVPPPRVESAVIRLVPHPTEPSPELLRAVERVTELAFGQRRKMLRGSLRALGGSALLDAAGIESTRRPESLSIAEFVQLATLLGTDVPAEQAGDIVTDRSGRLQ